MNISNIFSTYKKCTETQQIRNRSALTVKHRASNKAEAVELLKEGKLSNKSIAEKTGISKTSISVYKSKLKEVA